MSSTMGEATSIPKSRSDTEITQEHALLDSPETVETMLKGRKHVRTPSHPNELTRTSSSSSGSSNSYQEDWEPFPPLDRLTVFDLLSNLALPQKLEKWQNTLTAQKAKVKKHQERLKSTSIQAKERMVGEWRKRMPTSEEQLEKYRKRMKDSVERLGTRWNDTATVTLREKVSFIAGVLNIFFSGYLIGAYPIYFHYWFAGQLLYFLPIRFYTYHKRGYHYFLADLCYFVNLLTVLSIWVFPRSKRLFLSTYCLAYGNNAVAIAMWRNSMVFHSLDKVTSLFIHIMPPVTLHCIVHLTPHELLQKRFPAAYNIKYSSVGSPGHYSLAGMMLWASIPYAIWQLSYHLLITVRRREKIAAGRPTSFTWLRRSYAKTWIGKFVLSLPEPLQEPAFMLIQYIYALLTLTPCPLWFWYRWASSTFLFVVFVWSIYNGATYYIDVFGKRFQNELEQLKRDVSKWQATPDGATTPDGNTALKSLDDFAVGLPDKPNHSAAEELPRLSGQASPTTETVAFSTGVDRKSS
ncbi:hypothetical protein LOZ51_000118 [Ophidiomyces ophidiicola]|nr:hypothetical protein LOZ55_002744 [Ophidiomyces ophidiicola]KAI1994195.1 hypothetical protein LOZ54_001039 [Ophidiomyces ophidiicola]KAI2003045.1 hypothetical protein LOZ51_000118 [Ophidiomyces ophidiicola]